MDNIVSVLALAGVLALIPTILYALIVWWIDRHEKEPVPLLIVAFVWGAIPAIVLALVLEIFAGNVQGMLFPEELQDFTGASIIAPLVEEAVKAIILVVLFLAYRREFDNVLDGIVYGAMVGLGFAFVENILYFTSAAYDVPEGAPPDIGGMVVLWFLRAGLFGLNHSMFTAFTGAALGLARSLKRGWQRGFVASLGLGAAMIFHGLHNGLTSSVALIADEEAQSGLILGACLGTIISDWGGIALIAVLAVVSSVREGRIIQETLLEEVSLGRFTPEEYATLISGGKRWSVRWSVLFSSGFARWRQVGKLFDLATELAFRKHRMADGDPIHQNISQRDIAKLRQAIDQLKMQMIYAR